MAIINTQPLQIIVDVSVVVSASGAQIPSFSQGLIGGSSTVIPSYGTNPRIRQYTSLAAMSADGFSSANPEYLAAQLYFGQSPAATYVWIGRQDLTAVGAITVGASGGTGYVVGDILTITQGGAQGGEVSVTTVASGVVTGLAVVPQNQGTGYTVANNLATTGGTGAGCQVDITAIGESILQALTTCRIYQSAWYAVMWCGAVTADCEAIAPYAQSAAPPMMYFHNTTDTAVVNGTAGNLLLTLSAAGYNRVYPRYQTTQGGNEPNNIYSGAAAMGVAMGRNTGLANSFYIMMFQNLIGIAAENLTGTQIANICINPTASGYLLGPHGNTVVDYQNGSYNIEQFGTVANGSFFDQIINQDMLIADIQVSVLNLLIAVTVPNDNAGYNMVATVITQACQRAATRGFIQPGIWTGGTVLNLTYGTALNNGYLVQFQPQSALTPAFIASRQCSPMYVCIITPGAIQGVTCQILVQL